jgi:hypothetical protein
VTLSGDVGKSQLRLYSLRRYLSGIYFKHIIHQRSWNSSIGKDWLGTELHVFGFWQGKGFSSLPHNSHKFWGLWNGYWALFPKKINWPEHEVKPSPPLVWRLTGLELYLHSHTFQNVVLGYRNYSIFTGQFIDTTI